ncbi:unnamed protein product [Phytomonas sp. Hart1]|nr:unnamed protein product [Phytomonas sp. Hart1]|eukprot:CCW71686.1 unnamed protein product [Phytomonas sp. isolate Hart1]
MLDGANVSFEGWGYSTRYNGTYVGVMMKKTRTRRRRWVALVRALPHAPIAFYLSICPGMETASAVANPQGTSPGGPSRAGSETRTPAKPEAEVREFVPLLGIPACTLRVARTAASQGSDSPLTHSRIIRDFITDEAADGTESSPPLPPGTPGTDSAWEFRRSSSGDSFSRESPWELGNLPSPASSFPAVPPSLAQVEVFEYQRRGALLGWTKASLPSRIPAWQDSQGRKVPKPSDTPAPAGWRWEGNWTLEQSANGGWEVLPEDHSIRRRCWQRGIVKIE